MVEKTCATTPFSTHYLRNISCWRKTFMSDCKCKNAISFVALSSKCQDIHESTICVQITN